jgi:hypothetical protein
MAVESTAITLTERMDALAAALRAAGVSPERSSMLLASAATATMHALTLDALLERPPKAAFPVRPTAGRAPAVATVSLAA